MSFALRVVGLGKRSPRNELERAEGDLQKFAKRYPKAASRAMNKSLTGTKTDMKSIVREEYNYKAKTLEKRISVKKSRSGTLEGRLRSKGRPVHLTDLTGTKWLKRKGVRVNVKKSTGTQLLRGAFIREGSGSGKRIVLVRTDDPGQGRRTQPPSRYPVEAKYAPHPEIVYNQGPIWARIQKAAADRIDKNVQHELDRELQKMKR